MTVSAAQGPACDLPLKRACEDAGGHYCCDADGLQACVVPREPRLDPGVPVRLKVRSITYLTGARVRFESPG